MRKGLCHKCWSSNVELVLVEGKPTCKACERRLLQHV